MSSRWRTRPASATLPAADCSSAAAPDPGTPVAATRRRPTVPPPSWPPLRRPVGAKRNPSERWCGRRRAKHQAVVAHLVGELDAVLQPVGTDQGGHGRIQRRSRGL